MIKYKKIQKLTKGIEVRPIQGKTVSTKDVAKEIEKTIGIPAIRTMGVLAAFVEMAYNHLEKGEPVSIDGFGTLKTGLSLEDGKAVARKINLVASVQMKERLKNIQVVEETIE